MGLLSSSIPSFKKLPYGQKTPTPLLQYRETPPPNFQKQI
jgi:hypothetical protein